MGLAPVLCRVVAESTAFGEPNMAKPSVGFAAESTLVGTRAGASMDSGFAVKPKRGTGNSTGLKPVLCRVLAESTAFGEPNMAKPSVGSASESKLVSPRAGACVGERDSLLLEAQKEERAIST